MFFMKSVVCLFIISVMCGGMMFTSVPMAQAASVFPPTGIPSTIELDGYMWSSTIGWISLNCKTGGTTGNNICGTGAGQSNYSVTVNNSSGYITGFAWSSNIGWIKFNPGGTFPTGSGTVAANARIAGTYSPLALAFEGWARACAGTTNGDCSTTGSRTDGWDGWIALKGDNYQLRLQSDGTMYVYKESGSVAANGDGFFWGSTNVGWIGATSSTKWSQVSATLTSTPSTGCTIPDNQSTCDTTLNWTFTPSNITSPTVNQTAPTVVNSINTGTPKSGTAVSGSRTWTLKYGTNSFQAKTGSSLLKSLNLNIGCEHSDYTPNAAGKCVFATSSVVTITFSATKKFIRSGEIPELNWVVSGVLNMTECTLSGPQVPNNYMTATTPTPSKNDTWSPTTGLTSFATYTLSCVNGAESASKTITIEVIPTVIEN
jgi:hypothetical protein